MSVSKDLLTAEGATCHAERMCSALHDHFATGSELGVHAGHVLATQSFRERGETVIVKPGDVRVAVFAQPAVSANASRRAQKHFTDHVRRMIKRTKAIGVVTVSEVWAVATAEAPDVTPEMDVSHHPARREAVIVSLEHVRTSGLWVAELTPSRLLGPFIRIDQECVARGVFDDLLDKARFA